MERSVQKLTEKKELPRIPNLAVDQEVIYPRRTNVIIDDVGINISKRSILRQQLKPNIIFQEPGEMTQELLKIMPRSLLENPYTALIFPLNGGKAVQKSLNESAWNLSCQQFVVKADRSRPNSAPIVQLPQDLVGQLSRKRITNLIVLDDVIVTGSTLGAIQREVYRSTDVVDDSQYSQSDRFGWSRMSTDRLEIDWYAGSWMTAARPKSQSGSLGEFANVYTGIYYRGESGQTPVNSLSTWLNDKRKGMQVLNAYSNKYSFDPKEFVQFINTLKGGVKP